MPDVIGTVSLRNPWSLPNHLEIEFRVYAYAVTYANLPRLVVHKS